MKRQEYKEKLERGIAQVRARKGFITLLLDGWRDIILEVSWEPPSPAAGTSLLLA